MVLPTYVTVEGVRFPGSFSQERVLAAMKYKPVKGDLFLVTYPKCGTTWSHQIVYLILKGGQPCQDPVEYHDRVPFIDMQGQKCFEKLIRPGALKTHLPVEKIPFSSEAKYIYVSRNPKDTCVSFYEHTRSVPGYKFQDGTFDEYFEIFIKGEVNYNDYFRHVRSWYDLRQSPNVLFLNFEEMNTEPEPAVVKIAKFMGNSYSEALRKNPEVLKDILHHSSFEVMKETTNELMRYMVPYGCPPRVAVKFVRKGKSGGWREMMSQEQSERMDQRINETLGDTELPALWRKYNCL